MKTVLEFEGDRLVMTHPCQQCGIEVETGDLCKQCLIDSYTDDQDEYCGQCDEGYTYHCIDGFCIDAETGCELCQRHCDFCNPLILDSKEAEERAALGQTLVEALSKKPKDQGK